MLTRDEAVLGMARLVNVSVSGALIATALDLPLHSNILVTPFHIDGSSERPIPACVIRAEPGAVGIEWRDMASPSVLALTGTDHWGRWELRPDAVRQL
jgi:hypothetical protein